MTFPSLKHATRFIDTVGAPAVEEVSLELRELGFEVKLTRGENAEDNLPFVNLSVTFPEQEEFKYQLIPVAHPTPSWAPRADVGKDNYYTVEVFTTRGTRGINLIGLTRQQVIADVVSAYETHLTYLHLGGEEGTSITGLETVAPTDWEDIGEENN